MKPAITAAMGIAGDAGIAVIAGDLAQSEYETVKPDDGVPFPPGSFKSVATLVERIKRHVPTESARTHFAQNVDPELTALDHAAANGSPVPPTPHLRRLMRAVEKLKWLNPAIPLDGEPFVTQGPAAVSITRRQWDWVLRTVLEQHGYSLRGWDKKSPNTLEAAIAEAQVAPEMVDLIREQTIREDLLSNEFSAFAGITGEMLRTRRAALANKAVAGTLTPEDFAPYVRSREAFQQAQMDELTAMMKNRKEDLSETPFRSQVDAAPEDEERGRTLLAMFDTVYGVPCQDWMLDDAPFAGHKNPAAYLGAFIRVVLGSPAAETAALQRLANAFPELGWDPQKPTESWDGVTTDPRSGRVIGLDLAGKLNYRDKHTAHILDELSAFQKLRTLHIAHTHVSMPIPALFWTCLPEIEVVDLEHCGIFGSISPLIATCSRLQHLNLTQNNVEGKIPAELWQLEQLETLLLSSNWFDGSLAIPAANHSPRLRTVDVSYNRLSGHFPTAIYQHPNLTMLRVAGNMLHGTINPPFPVALTHFDIENNELTSFPLPRLFPKIQELRMSNNPMKATLNPTMAREWQELRVFQANNCGLEGRIPDNLGDLKNIQDLQLDNNPGLHGRIVVNTQFQNLKRLVVDGFKLTVDIAPSRRKDITQSRY